MGSWFKGFVLGIAALLASPVLVYNAMLYRAVGHFDFQLSFIFGQHPAVWQATPGKDIGALSERIANFVPRLIATNSWLFLLLAVASLAAAVHKQSPDIKSHIKDDPFPVIPAAAFLARAKLQGLRVGGAEISRKHPNYIVNRQNASAKDVLLLIAKTKKQIQKKFFVLLEEEITFPY